MVQRICAPYFVLGSAFMAAFAFGCGSNNSRSESVSKGGTSATGGSAGGLATGGSETVSGGTSAAGSTAGGNAGTGSGGSGGAGPSGGSAGNAGTAGTAGGPSQTVGACDDLGEPGEWQNIKPEIVETTQAIALDPFHIGTLWLGTSGGTGLFKSTDCGSSWTHVNTGIKGEDIDNCHMWSLAIDPVNEGVVYVIGAYGPQGLFKSTNAGVDWVQLFSEESEFAQTVPYNFVGSVSLDPHDPLHLAVGTHSNCLGEYGPACGAESTDGGDTWSFFSTPFMSGWAEQTGPYVLDATSMLYATLFDGLWLTRNNGQSWDEVTPAGVNGATGGEYTHGPIPTGPDGTLYLPSISQGGLLQSTDNGSTWSRVEGAPTGSYELGIAIGGGNVYLGDEQGRGISVAPLSDITNWTTVPELPAPNKPPYLEYDEEHHVLYAAGAGLMRMVTP